MELVLYGNKGGDFLSRELVPYLKQRYPIVSIQNNQLYSAELHPEMVLLETEYLNQIFSKHCIVLLKHRISPECLEHLLTEGVQVFFHSENPCHLKAVAKLSVPVISCGLSQKDTLTFSSIEPDRAVVSLQRSVEFGEIIRDPMEITLIHTQGYHPYTLLCIAGISLFLEETDELKLDLSQKRTDF